MPTNDKSTLEQHFEEVRRIFFPRWDRQKRWRVYELPSNVNVPWSGRCMRSERIIAVGGAAESMIELWVALIHEICHAVTRSEHGDAFWTRMRKVADRATGLGMISLADTLESHIKYHKKNLPQPEKACIQRVIGEILVDIPTASSSVVISSIAEARRHEQQKQ